MLEKTKEYAISDFIEMIEKSWTWERLTEEERERFLKRLSINRYQNAIKGTYLQRWETLQNLYDMYLGGLGIWNNATGWRE